MPSHTPRRAVSRRRDPVGRATVVPSGAVIDGIPDAFFAIFTHTPEAVSWLASSQASQAAGSTHVIVGSSMRGPYGGAAPRSRAICIPSSI